MIEDIGELKQEELEALSNKGYRLQGQLADGRIFVAEPDGCAQLYSWNQLKRLIKECSMNGKIWRLL